MQPRPCGGISRPPALRQPCQQRRRPHRSARCCCCLHRQRRPRQLRLHRRSQQRPRRPAWRCSCLHQRRLPLPLKPPPPRSRSFLQRVARRQRLLLLLLPPHHHLPLPPDWLHRQPCMGCPLAVSLKGMRRQRQRQLRRGWPVSSRSTRQRHATASARRRAARSPPPVQRLSRAAALPSQLLGRQLGRLTPTLCSQAPGPQQSSVLLQQRRLCRQCTQQHRKVQQWHHRQLNRLQQRQRHQRRGFRHLQMAIPRRQPGPLQRARKPSSRGWRRSLRRPPCSSWARSRPRLRRGWPGPAKRPSCRSSRHPPRARQSAGRALRQTASAKRSQPPAP